MGNLNEESEPESNGAKPTTPPTYLFDEADETASEAPRLVTVALQGADSDLLRLLHRHRHHVHGVVHQRRVSLQKRGKEGREERGGWVGG